MKMGGTRQALLVGLAIGAAQLVVGQPAPGFALQGAPLQGDGSVGQALSTSVGEITLVNMDDETKVETTRIGVDRYCMGEQVPYASAGATRTRGPIDPDGSPPDPARVDRCTQASEHAA